MATGPELSFTFKILHLLSIALGDGHDTAVPIGRLQSSVLGVDLGRGSSLAQRS